MKNFSAAAVAAITALSLSTGAAAAAPALGAGSSEADSEIRQDIIGWQGENPTSDSLTKEPTSSIDAANNSSETAKENSSEENHNSLVESSWGIAKSSVKNDIENSDAIGTTLDTIIGIGAIAAIGAAIYNFAVQSGFSLPNFTR